MHNARKSRQTQQNPGENAGDAEEAGCQKPKEKQRGDDHEFDVLCEESG
jgi:hypothetical protein